MESPHRYRATALGHVIAEQGRKQEWVAAQGRVHGSVISHVIAGRRTMSADSARRIADALGVPVFVLFDVVTPQVMVTTTGGEN